MVTKRKKKAGYFNNEEMLDLFIERNRLRDIQEKTKEENIQLKKIENKIGILFFKISEGMLHRPNFCNYDSATKAEMISDAVYNCLRAGERYDVNYKNPFGYFSQISWNAFILNIKSMKKRTGIMVNISHVENLDGCDDTIGE